MKILIIGFQRSGTTLLRRMLHGHPEVRRMFHEEFLLKKCQSKDSLYKYLINHKISPDKDTWGEKVPFYPSVRKISVLKYCDIWNDYFGEDARILHIIRHPIDVAFSIDKMYRNQSFNTALRVYKKIMPKIVPKLLELPFVYTFKYEDLLINSEKIIPQIFTFCDLNSEVDFKKLLTKNLKDKYKKLDPTRAFAYKTKSLPYSIKGLENSIEILNKVKGPEYKI